MRQAGRPHHNLLKLMHYPDPCPLPYTFLTDSLNTSTHAFTSGDGSLGLASYSILKYPLNLTDLSALRTDGTSRAPLPNTTSVSLALSWSFRCMPKLRAPMTLTCSAGSSFLLNGALPARIKWPVSRHVPIRGLWSLTAARMISAEYQRCSFSP